MRFGLMQIKMGIISIISNYEVRVSQKTPVPLVFDDRGLVLSVAGGIWLQLVNRKDRSN
jgi:cytochrome P450 family 6